MQIKGPGVYAPGPFFVPGLALHFIKSYLRFALSIGESAMHRLFLLTTFLTLAMPVAVHATQTMDMPGMQPMGDMSESPGHPAPTKRCPPPTASNPTPGCKPPPSSDMAPQGLKGPLPVNGASGAPTQSPH